MAADATEIFINIKDHKDAAKFYISYVYFMRQVYELKYLFKVACFKIQNKLPFEYNKIKQLLIDI